MMGQVLVLEKISINETIDTKLFTAK
jgi:hypothetical protein